MIHKATTAHPYAPSSYDDDMCLKPPLLLWLAVLYLCRGIALPFVIGIGHYAGVNADAMMLLREYWSQLALLPSALALPMLIALCRRSNGASDATRWVWRHGKLFMAPSCIADALVALVPHWGTTGLNDAFVLSLSTVGVDAYFLLYVMLARRVRDTFLDFPPRLRLRT